MKLQNDEAEQCAQQIAACFHDKIKRQEIYSAFVASHPSLKHWEGLAVGSRAMEIVHEAPERLETNSQRVRRIIAERNSKNQNSKTLK